MKQKSTGLTSVVFALQSRVQVFRWPPQSALSSTTAQGDTIVPFSLLNWTRLVAQHVHQSSESTDRHKIKGKVKVNSLDYRYVYMIALSLKPILVVFSYLGILSSLLRACRDALLKATLMATATATVNEITPPMT